MARLVLDSSVLIAYFNAVDAHHASAITRLRRASGDECVLIASVLAEILVHPYRVGPEAVSEVEAALAALRMVVLPIDAGSHVVRLSCGRQTRDYDSGTPSSSPPVTRLMRRS